MSTARNIGISQFGVTLLACVVLPLFAAQAEPGRVDLTFHPGSGADATVLSVAAQRDGKVLIGGAFSTVNGVARNRIARLNGDGTLDTSFDPGSGTDLAVLCVVVQPDGKILIGGYFTRFNDVPRSRIARLNADGSLDTGFDPGLGADYNILAIAVQPDGRVLIGGNFSRVGQTERNRIAMLNPGGALNTFFNPGEGANGEVSSLAVQSDGRVLLAGDFTSVAGSARGRIARLNLNGSLDTSFNPGAGADRAVWSVVAQADGQVLIAGAFNQVDGTARNRLARLKADGSLDVSFDPGSGADEPVACLALQEDGKILIGGGFTNVDGIARKHIARLEVNGSVDTSFNPGSGANGWVWSVAMLADGRAFIGGGFTQVNGTERNGLARILGDPVVNAMGRIDESFYPGFGVNGWVGSVVELDNGKVLIGGGFRIGSPFAYLNIARLNADGSLDRSFNLGYNPNGSSGPNNLVSSIAVQADGKVLIGGHFDRVTGTPRRGIARLNANGSLDDTFNTAVGANGPVAAVAVQSDGKVLIGGAFTSVNGAFSQFIARLNANGTLDTTFNTGFGANGYVSSLAVQPDGKILVAGGFTGINGILRNRIARLNENGSLDYTFNPGSDPGSGADDSIWTFAVQPDGKIVIGGDFARVYGTTRSRIARLNENGTLDMGFDPGSGANGLVASLAVQPDGKILAGGDFTRMNGRSHNRISRLNADGSPDDTFNRGSGANGPVWSLWLQPDLKLLVGGGFTSVNGTVRNGIAQLVSDPMVPVFLLHPRPVSADNGATVILTAAATGAGPLSYQWRKDGVDLVDGERIVGATSATLILSNAHATDSGDYTVQVTSNGRAPISHAASLTVSNVVGRPDPTFTPPDFRNSTASTAPNTSAEAVALQPDGKVVISFWNAALNAYDIVRVNHDGTRDTDFNPRLWANQPVTALAVQTDARIVIGGNFTRVYWRGPLGTTVSTLRNRIARLNEDGSIDYSFGSGFAPSGADGGVGGLALQADGKVVIGGNFANVDGTARNGFARLHTDGRLDVSFVPAIAGSVFVVQKDGKVVVSGSLGIVRLNENGSLDTSFTRATSANSQGDGSVRAIAVQEDGRIIIGGGFSIVNGTPRSGVARLNTDGSLDMSFSPTLFRNDSEPLVLAVAVQNDGKVVIGGYFNSLDGVPRNNIARLNGNGSLDLNFDPGSGANAGVHVIALQVDSNVIIGGPFTRINESPQYLIARLRGQPMSPAPVTQPQPLSILIGGTASFTATATGPGNLFYQWRRNGVSLVDGDGISGATTDELTVWNVQGTDAGSYDVVVINESGAALSQAAVLSVSPAPQPPRVLSESLRRLPNGTFQFTVQAEPNVLPVIEVTEDFITWPVISLPHTPPDETGLVTFTEPEANARALRFYRARLP